MKYLYRVKIYNHTDYYVVAGDTSTAYALVRNFLNKNDYFFTCERELRSIEVIAQDNKYSKFPLLVVED